jgi:para-nitrobenzyl esterase
MRRHFHLMIACCLAFVLTNPSHPFIIWGSLPPTVTLEVGALEGIHFSSAPNEVAFLGVPYAATPVGDLRWKPPQPVSKWAGTRKATQFGASCPQLPAAWLPDLGWNEDCLYLNVWTTKLSASSRRPVIVWFHGGGNKAGRSQHTPLGPALSRLGVVVVSVNYRLGPLGFLAHPALTAESEHHASGNYGLLDQLHALKWIRENVSRFGGDPGRITVMGHSAGAVDTCLLMASPMAAGLFQRAILQSGDCQSILNQDIRAPLPYNSIVGSGESVGERLANELGVANDPRLLRNLRSISADKILEAWSKDPQVSLDAVVDGWVIPEQPAKIFAEGKQLHIPVLVGSTADEATIFVGHNGPKTVEQYKKYLLADTGKYADQEFQAYPAASDADVPARFLQLQNDVFAYGAHSIARSMARAGQKAYLYYFSYVGRGKRAQFGAHHGEELWFLSDSFPSDWERSPDDKKLGEIMRAYWTQFAKKGDPNSTGIPDWPAYDARQDQCFELGRTIRVRSVNERLYALDRIMKQIFAETANAQPWSKSR